MSRKFIVTLRIDDLQSSVNDVAEENSESDAERKLNSTLHGILNRYIVADDSLDVEVDIDAGTITAVRKEAAK